MSKATESRPEPVYIGLGISQPSFLASFSLNGNNICFAEVALVVKNSLANEGDKRDMGSIHGMGRSPGGGHGTPLQYSCLGNPMDRGAWWATVHSIAKSQTQLKRLSTHCITTTMTGNNEISNSWCFRALSEVWEVLFIYIDPYYCIKLSATVIPVSQMRKPKWMLGGLPVS